ncbi:MAG TPA: helix-hairpin-helix domain-containing protein [Bacteroidota bacterium]|nr:helix-hairpin-helix domain-containing protein [Bacteroidota bacterium]
MKLLKRLQEFAAFTKNEQRIFFFLSVVFLVGVSVKAYKAYFSPEPVRQFDYSASDKEFEERSRYLTAAPPAADSGTIVAGRPDRKGKKKINLNTATKDELRSLPGIGDGIAEQILIYRDEHGGFSSVDQLRKIKGIGVKKLEKLRPRVVLK